MRRAFTLIEVLISLVILVVGVLSVLSLLPVTVRSAQDTTDRLTLSARARTIVDALQLGAREGAHAVHEDDGAGGRRVAGAFVLLPHPAAGELPVVTPGAGWEPAVLAHPACLLLPYGTDARFVYPRLDPAAENGGGDASRARDDWAATQGTDEPLVRAVYAAAGEPYGFALSIQRATIDGRRRDGLYSVTILLYRGFDPAPGVVNRPSATFITQVRMGPAAP